MLDSTLATNAHCVLVDAELPPDTYRRRFSNAGITRWSILLTAFYAIRMDFRRLTYVPSIGVFRNLSWPNQACRAFLRSE